MNLVDINLVPDVVVSEIDDEHTVAVANSETYCITVDPAKITDLNHLSEIVAHELVHLDQLGRGELVVDGINGCYIWKGIEIDFEDFDYDNAPWEIDADVRAELICTKL